MWPSPESLSTTLYRLTWLVYVLIPICLSILIENGIILYRNGAFPDQDQDRIGSDQIDQTLTQTQTQTLTQTQTQTLAQTLAQTLTQIQTLTQTQTLALIQTPINRSISRSID